jgi:excisionase family DNA binding protein
MSYLRVSEVARMLGICVDEVRRKIKAGQLEARKAGSEWRIEESAVRAFVAAHWKRTGEGVAVEDVAAVKDAMAARAAEPSTR